MEGEQTASNMVALPSTPGPYSSSLCGCSFWGPLTNTKETTQKPNPLKQPVLGGWSLLPPLPIPLVGQSQEGLRALESGRQAEVRGDYIPGDQLHLGAEWAGDPQLLSQFPKESFLCHGLLERVEHNPILTLSGGKQVVLLTVGPCEDLGSSQGGHLSVLAPLKGPDHKKGTGLGSRGVA